MTFPHSMGWIDWDYKNFHNAAAAAAAAASTHIVIYNHTENDRKYFFGNRILMK